ncbi:hypothetical protein [Methanosphaera sp. WGK6]|uniref:hypothetical protein n=1 Tax=Methanosphaera sp. WGK6 TaxID=1561964 RepID=UPI00084C3153|nr:hypothetical protein [Methanosphaera sp. WGK6]OED29564.1 hypothetical protein NL43_07695 [Methanosphaera sp. WGK6]
MRLNLNSDGRSDKKKIIGIIAAVCCLGIIIMAVMGGGTSDQNTAPTTTNDTDTKNTTSNTADNTNTRINASGENMTFFGMDTEVGSKGYQFATRDENGTMYYMDYDTGMLVAKCDPNTLSIVNWDLKTTSEEGLQYSGTTIGSSGINHILTNQPRDHEKVQFSYPRGGNFVFTYHTEKLLYNSNARIIDKVYYPNGVEIKKDDSNTKEYSLN